MLSVSHPVLMDLQQSTASADSGSLDHQVLSVNHPVLMDLPQSTASADSGSSGALCESSCVDGSPTICC